MYDVISAEFGYDKKKDDQSARRLAGMLKNRKDAYCKLQKLIKDKTVFVVGAGPSLHASFNTILNHADDAVVIAADTALMSLLRNGIKCNVVVTDLDGDMPSHEKAAKCGAIMAVHAHGDNMHMLHHVKQFDTCIGTTQTAPLHNIRNFGGFTDGDRAVFLAAHFMPKNIILFGMDFGSQVGAYSDTDKSDYDIKIRKMQMGKILVEKWLPNGSKFGLYTTGSHIKGFERISHEYINVILKAG